MEFSWYDYLIFAAMLIFSTSIGIYYGCFGSKQATVSKYLLGGRKMSPLPVALSVVVGHFSSVTLLGRSADVYKYGAYYIFMCISITLLALMTIYFYYSVFFNLNLTSIYEYLEKRFDRRTRLLGAFLYILSDILMLPVTAYGPSLALSAATGIHVYWISAVTCGLCIFYTSIGGLKTVIWTDFYQLALILISLTMVLIIGFTSAGGFLVIWNKAVEGGRFNIFDFDPNPTKRDSIWTYVVGLTITWTYHMSLSQSAVQKYLALPTFKDCIRSVIYYVVAMSLVIIFCVLFGVAMYEKYSSCDPLLSHKIKKHDQLLPYYVMDVAGKFPGIPGLFLVVLFCASLSSISSILNAVSGVIYKDFICKFCSTNIRENKAVLTLKIIVVVIGLLSLCLTFLIEHMGELITVVVSLEAIAGGPLVGMFTLGVLFPRANSKGAFYGTICGLIFTSCLIIPIRLNFVASVSYPTKLLSTSGCEILNNTSVNISDRLDIDKNASADPFYIFRISFAYYGAMGTAVTIILGLIISWVTNKEAPDVDERLISPLIRSLLRKGIRSEGTVLLTQTHCKT